MACLSACDAHSALLIGYHGMHLATPQPLQHCVQATLNQDSLVTGMMLSLSLHYRITCVMLHDTNVLPLRLLLIASLQLGLLSESEAEAVIAVEFNPVRVGFHGGADVWTRDVLNLGVKPDKLIALVSYW